ncbi:MAG: 2-C-methyl-D-erythritol 4-phosphate cytidylyltransferase [archaeon]
MANTAILLGAGKGTRIGKKHKPFLILGNKPLLSYSLGIFNNCRFIDEIIVVVNKNKIEDAEHIVDGLRFDKKYRIISGGKTRQESVYKAIRSISNSEYVLVHDVARPFITLGLVRKIFQAAKEYGAAIPAIPLRDTIKKGRDFVEETLDRDFLWEIQTPQGFRYDLLNEAHNLAFKDKYTGTDDASLVERRGYKVKMVLGTRKNLKITYPLDIIIAESLV